MTRRAWALLAVAAAPIAHAQSVDSIETVLVQAGRRETPIQDVPISVSALSATELADGGITNADGLAERLTTFDVTRNAGINTTSLRIRRIGNIGNIPTFEPAVGLFVDGAFRSRSFFGTGNLLAIDHVELLKGPQTALYGKNVSAGLLALYTRKPSDELTVSGELTRGWIEAPRTTDADVTALDLSGPITAQLRGGIAGRFEEHGHTIMNVQPGAQNGNDERQLALRGQLSFSPTDDLDLRLLTGYVRNRDDDGESDVYLAPGAASTQVSQLLQQFGLTPGCADNVPRNRKVCSVATNKLELKAEDATLLGEYRLANGQRLKSVTSWDHYSVLRIEPDAIQLFAPMLFYDDGEGSHSVQEEITLESANDAKVAWIAGAFYYDNDYERGDHGRVPMFGANGALAYNPIWSAILGLPLAIPGQLGVHDSTLDTRYVSVFGQVSWHITERLALSTALRWQQEKKDAVINNSVTAPGLSLISAILTPTTTLAGQPVNGSLSRTSENEPWSVTADYRLSPEAMTYLTVARGFKSGGFNTGFGDAPLANREFGDETIHHYELGTKTAFADHRVRLDASAFYTQYDNYQDAAFISAQFSVKNAQKVDLKGVELEGQATLAERLALDFAVSLADLRYVRYTGGLCAPGRAPDGDPPASCDLSGKHPIQAPLWETHLGVQYDWPVQAGNVQARLDWSWTSRYNTSFSADPRLTQRSYNDVALRASVPLAKSADLTFWVHNLLNETVSPFDLLLNLFNDASYQSYLDPPRTFGMTVHWHF